ncbi:MAG TPA: molecular chaperone HtpG [Spirochaetales bacterium]|nr:molecular chaperone HtpG [Spirochaetales bacterium]HRZ64191.1 molecular chaperone HtpG [Spirochaetia bacterium]
MSQHHFKTEVSRLLDLIIHSLYSHKEIFLRELVSNASDAIDKLRYLTVSDEAYKSISFEPSIRVVLDRESKTLVVEDDGVGMDEKELEENLGTIARSGTRRFLEKLPEEARKDSNLIGQFGVGFYSAFMVADKVEVTSKKAGTETAFRWTSDGKGEYSVEPAERVGPGTEVRLHLNGEGQEYLARWTVEGLLKKYSNHIAYPISLVSEEKKYGDEGKEEGTERKEEVVNAATALWRRPKSELSEADYVEFYKSFSASLGGFGFGAEGAEAEPLLWMHTKAEGAIEYSTLFYIPSKAPSDLYRADYKPGVKLYVRRVFITDDEKELLPVYLRFVRGVIDSEDLPLNVSREILQQNRVMSSIRQASVKKILGELAELAKVNPDKYAKFVEQFNRPLKEGLYSDFANREALLGLVRWKSTAAEGWTSFADYRSRMKEGQKAVYYIAGADEERLRRSPLLEMYRKEGIEVLVCSDEIDELVISGLGQFDGAEIKSVSRSGSEADFGEAEKDEAGSEGGAEVAQAVEKAKKALGEAVKDVRASKRLAESPACVVVDSDDPSLQFRELMKQLGGGELPDVKPILELNPGHGLVKRLAAAPEAEAEDLAQVLLGQALLVEGAKLADPVDFAARLSRLLS